MTDHPPLPAAPLPAGTRAPLFRLPSSPGRVVSLEEFRGRPVVLAFYPADWSPVCGDQMALYSALHTEWDRFNAVLLGVSVDGVWCHAAFTQERNLRQALLSDFEPKGEVARRYGVYEQESGTSGRALFVIDGGGIIRWSYLSPDAVNPGADGILEALEKLTPKEAASGRKMP
jgi:peroxiredoxin